ncbi:hypothetical protein BLD48_06445 [Exiguobacterium sp. KRL4]|uniref:GNAT family N-acetyltransferase n=1 Tax=Exiguobacterium sp. KRL4 TaxID=1914536 RepID=UPI0008F83D15|nr:GNAT family N-acetyltransferase [Exiguobacterium sp. KRL4]OIN67262.1 hypothetical protein BLD48_06445 [Exiguobacterium sp. KRL4]
MIHIKRAPDTETAFSVMQEGFSDYMIPLGLSREVFQERILERDGNQLEHSFIAYHGERPVAIWLNGLKNIKKQTVMRCGGLAVDPQYRRLGIAKALYDAQLSYAKSIHINRLTLEVIQGNQPAISLYQKFGYQTVDELGYFLREEPDQTEPLIEIDAVAFERRYIQQGEYIWQQDQTVMKQAQAQYYELDGAFIATANESIFAIVTEEEDVARVATEATRRLTGTRYQLQSTNQQVWEDLRQAGWQQRELKQFVMSQTI